jgi:hypothetical protein
MTFQIFMFFFGVNCELPFSLLTSYLPAVPNSTNGRELYDP